MKQGDQVEFAWILLRKSYTNLAWFSAFFFDFLKNFTKFLWKELENMEKKIYLSLTNKCVCVMAEVRG